MPATLTVPMPDDLLARIRQRAADTGTTPEVVAADALATAPVLEPGYGKLRKWAGAIPLGDGNVSERIDEILGDALVDELRGKPDA